MFWPSMEQTKSLGGDEKINEKAKKDRFLESIGSNTSNEKSTDSKTERIIFAEVCQRHEAKRSCVGY